MFSVLNVSQLIADHLGSSDICINICVRVTIYPDINPTFSDEIIKIICESRIERTPLVMICEIFTYLAVKIAKLQTLEVLRLLPDY